MDKMNEDLINLIRDHKLSTETADKDLSNRIAQLNEQTVANANKASADNMQTNKLLENADNNLRSQVKDSNDRNAKLREYCNDTFNVNSI